jgi:transcriptional regulator with XRE-family HTH domain
MDALAVNTSPHQFGRRLIRGENTDMYKNRRDTPVGRLIAGKGISDNALARLLKVPQPTITRLANGTTKEPGRELVQKLAVFFEVSEAEILGGEAPRKPKAATGKLVSTGSGRTIPIPGDALSAAAMEVARTWSKLSAGRQEEFRDALYWACFFESKFPFYRRGRPAGAHYDKFESGVEADFRRLLKASPEGR